MAKSDEADLVARFREGDRDAFRRLVERHERILLTRLAARLPAHLRRRVSVADLVQETCLVAYERRRDFEDRGDGAFGKWLAGIAENRVRDAVKRHAGASKRSARREVTRGQRPETGCLPAAQGTPSGVASSAEQVAGVRAAMLELSADHREVLRLALEEGLTLGECAERMGRTREAAKKLYGRAVCALRARLGAEA
jgi:RNA polymerase sigma-70 factor (ECF subfamily)